MRKLPGFALGSENRMQFTVSSEARALGLEHARVWWLSSGRSLLADDGLDARLAGSLYEPEESLPCGYRKLLADLGYPEIVPAGERLRDLVRERGWRSHGSVIDAVTVATLKHGAGIGLHRALSSGDERSLVLTRASGAERIVPAFSSRSRPVPAGDLVYGAGEGENSLEPFAWLGRRDCDSAGHQLTQDDREALLVVLGCPGLNASDTGAIGDTVRRVLESVRPDIVMSEVPRS